MSHCLPLWIPGTYDLLEGIENVKEQSQNADLYAVSSDTMVQHAYTVCDTPVLHGPCCLRFQWASPVQLSQAVACRLTKISSSTHAVFTSILHVLDQHIRSPSWMSAQPFSNSLHHLPKCCTLIMPSPYTFINLW
jgi:hypothetical protein